jgi:hypothetical protein
VLQRVTLEVAKVDARRGADVLLEVLESEGVQYIFGNPGTTTISLQRFDDGDVPVGTELVAKSRRV